MKYFVLLTLFFLVCNSANAKIYSCEDKNGKKSFQDIPCGNSKTISVTKTAEDIAKEKELNEQRERMRLEKELRESKKKNEEAKVSREKRLKVLFDKMFSVWAPLRDPEIIKLYLLKATLMIRNDLRDPDSFKLEDVQSAFGLYYDKELLKVLVDIHYRARNGFGGYNRSVARAEIDLVDSESFKPSSEAFIRIRYENFYTFSQDPEDFVRSDLWWNTPKFIRDELDIKFKDETL